MLQRLFVALKQLYSLTKESAFSTEVSLHKWLQLLGVVVEPPCPVMEFIQGGTLLATLCDRSVNLSPAVRLWAVLGQHNNDSSV